MGAAMKIDDEVPTTMPNSMIQAKPESAEPPNRANGSAARKTVPEVPRVRFRVSLMDWSMSLRSGIVLYLRRFSRTRS